MHGGLSPGDPVVAGRRSLIDRREGRSMRAREAVGPSIRFPSEVRSSFNTQKPSKQEDELPNKGVFATKSFPYFPKYILVSMKCNYTSTQSDNKWSW
jgi:hypothetical protein